MLTKLLVVSKYDIKLLGFHLKIKSMKKYLVYDTPFIMQREQDVPLKTKVDVFGRFFFNLPGQL